MENFVFSTVYILLSQNLRSTQVQILLVGFFLYNANFVA